VADGTTRRLAEIPNVTILNALYVQSNFDGTAQVDFGQGLVPVAEAGDYTPEAGTAIRVVTVNERTVILGPAVPRPKVGEITATGTPLLTVTTESGEESLPLFIPYTTTAPQVGDVVVIDRSYSNGVVMGRLSTFPSSKYETPGAPVQSGNFSTDFRATDSGTFYIPGGKWSSNDIWATGTGNNTGAWFFASTIADTIPDQAIIRRVQIFLPEYYNAYPSTPTQIGLHGDVSRAGNPSIGTTAAVAAGRGWRDLPTWMGDQLKTGAAKGVGTNGATSGNTKYTGRAGDADSGLLRIDYSV